MSKSFRDSASFGKRMEYKLIGDMLMEGLDCYVPLVDDHGVDCVIKKDDGTFIEVQIKLFITGTQSFCYCQFHIRIIFFRRIGNKLRSHILV